MTHGTGSADVEGAHVPPAAVGPSLDREAEIWVGTFPGLGSVRIHPDGEIQVTAAERAADDRDTVEMRERALRHGWGESLSFARRGFRQAYGAAVGPIDGGACMLVLGDPHDVAIVLIELVQHGWAVLGDRPTPLEWDTPALTAFPRSAPVVVSKRRAAKAELAGTRLRGDTDALALDLPRIDESRRVAALVSLQMRKPDEDALTPLTGHERFENAASLFIRGALWPAEEAGDETDVEVGDETARGQAAARDQAEPDKAVAEMMADHLALSRFPAARLRFDSATKDDDVAALLAWWHTLAEATQ